MVDSNVPPDDPGESSELWRLPPAGEHHERELNALFTRLRAFVLRVLGSRMRGVPQEDIEDVCAEVLIKVHRFCQRAEPENLRRVASHAIPWVIADYWRGKHEGDDEPSPDNEAAGEPVAPEPLRGFGVDDAADLQFQLMELSRHVSPECVSIMVSTCAYGLKLDEQARQRGIEHAAMRARSSRCAKRFRLLAETHPELLDAFGAYLNQLEDPEAPHDPA